MKITLYKNCKLNNQYTEVYHHSALETYLNTLTKISYEYDAVYQTNYGTINFELDYTNNNSVYEYNYMKVETTDEEGTYNFKRYCFIDDIVIRNGVASIHYSEDVWASYSQNIHFNKSFLSRSKAIKYGTENVVTKTISLFTLPVDYNGNNKLTIVQDANVDKWVVIGQCQFYNASSYGSSTERQCRTFVLENITTASNNTRTIKPYFTSLQVAQKQAQRFIISSSQNGKYNEYTLEEGYHTITETDMYFKIDNITIIPYYYIQDFMNEYYNLSNYGFREFSGDNTASPADVSYVLEESLSLESLKGFTEGQTPPVREPLYFFLKFTNTYCGDRYLTKGKNTDITISNNFKNVSMGFVTSQFPIVSNGTDIIYNFYVTINNYNFDLFLNISNELIKVTNSFVVDIPIETIDGEIQTQRRLNRIVQTINGSAELVGDAVSLGTSMTGTSISQLTKTGRIARNKMARTQRGIDYTNEITGTATSMISGITGLIQTNAPVYTSNTGTFATSDGLLNAYYGVIILAIDSDNDTYVTEMINTTGYNVYELNFDALTNLPYNADGSALLTQNAIKYDFVSIYGAFTQNINQQLTSILLNGFVINY